MTTLPEGGYFPDQDPSHFKHALGGDPAPAPAAPAAPAPAIQLPPNLAGPAPVGGALDTIIKDATSHLASAALNREAALTGKQKLLGDAASVIEAGKPGDPPAIPKLPSAPTFNATPPLQQFGSLASTLGILGAFMTRRPAIAALNASAAAMASIQRADYRNFQTATETWENETAAMLKGAKLESERYGQIVENQRHTTDQKLNLIRMEAEMLKDRVMIDAAKTGDYALVEKMISDKAQLGLSAQRQYDAISPQLTLLRGYIDETIKKTGKPPTAQEAVDYWGKINAVRFASAQKVQDLVDRGIPLQEAQDIAAGRVKLGNDEFGNQTLTNTVTGVSRKVTPGEAAIIGGALGAQPTAPAAAPGAAPAAPPAAPGTPPPAAQAAPAAAPGTQVAGKEKNIFGIVPWLKQLSGETVGQLGFGNFPEVTQARTDMRVLRESVIDAYQSSGRPAVAEQERVLGLVPSLGVMESPGSARDKLGRVRVALMKAEADELARAGSREVSADERKKARIAAQKFRSTIDMLGEEKAGTQDMPATPVNQAEFDKLKPGDFYVNPKDNEVYRKK